MPFRFYPDPKHFKVREFFVDLLGSLVPGFIFTFLAVVALGLPIKSLCENLIQCVSYDGKKVVKYEEAYNARDASKMVQTPESWLKTFRFEMIFFGVTLSYVVGHFFFRRTPKIPDTISVWRTKKELIDDVPAVLLHPDILKKRSFLSRLEEGIELFFGVVPRVLRKFEKNQKINVHFPYLCIWEYLDHRGLDHLAKMIPWKGGDVNTHPRRAKAFINLLKIRLEFVFPEKCGNITRNEAHIRLMSSVWYMSCYLQRIAVFSFLLSLAFFVVGMCHIPRAKACVVCWPPIICSAFIVIGMWIMRLIIEKFFHYQRVREIVYVLETAHYAAKYGVYEPEKARKVSFPEIIRDLGTTT